jgi:hypothetical protein
LAFFLQTRHLPASTDPKVPDSAAIVHTVTGLMAGLGICGLSATLWLWFRASQTTYFLTSRRVVIDTAEPLPRRTSLPLEHIRFIEISGVLGPRDLIFNETRRITLDGWGPRGEGFIAIPDAAGVEKLIGVAIEQTFAARTRGPWQ